MEKETIALEVLTGMALDASRVLVERQRAIDALTLFHEQALGSLKKIERTTDLQILKERCRLYVRRITDGAAISMTL
ncbi:MAG: hypothetical protein JXO48_04005 [Deltaproteobacteria bacterium]|nr:hypothetical protein [Deltaproteobacteria bacterium]